MRFVRTGDSIAYDSTRRMDGRGYYLCRDDECVNEALKRSSFNRVCRCKLDSEDIKRVVFEALGGN